MFSMTEGIQKMEEATKDSSNDYLDGILFARDRGVICTGRLTNVLKDGVRIQRFSRARDPWFYLHAKRIIDESIHPVTESIPLVDYLFRYDCTFCPRPRFTFTNLSTSLGLGP
jgi:Delta24-sterol reductase